MNDSQDFIVSELLSELKDSTARKDAQIQSLHKLITHFIVITLTVVLLIIGGFLWYLNQYDFSSTQTIQQSAEGVYALIDSEGNTIAMDLSSEDITRILEVIDSGKDAESNNNN